ncbi:hypothetical protein [Streptomyces sp. NPDC005209]|uniref:hypothetical protein n=1 Tax=Streptomyces sp. NPDC005209 TaxID=3156715 RepID=UPI00339DC239
MPRNRPGALRARRSRALPHTRETPPPVRIPGLSARTSLAIHRVESASNGFLIRVGATDEALRRYRAFLSRPGLRTLYPREAFCPSCPGCALDDVRHARDVLAEILPLLPPRARGELRRALLTLDRHYRTRTLPDPLAAARGEAPWWHGRLADGAEGW